MGNINLKIPYKLNFNTIAANSILPPKGDSTCAFSNHVFKNITGVFTAKAINIPQNKKNCVE
jgi:phosphoribosylaminoimidazole-succinocarboxamide synthase